MKRNRKRTVPTRNLGNYLREKRETNNFTQNELASKLGYSSPQFVSNWERGLARPPTVQLKAISKLLKIDRKELIGFLVDLDKQEWERQL